MLFRSAQTAWCPWRQLRPARRPEQRQQGRGCSALSVCGPLVLSAKEAPSRDNEAAVQQQRYEHDDGVRNGDCGGLLTEGKTVSGSLREHELD